MFVAFLALALLQWKPYPPGTMPEDVARLQNDEKVRFVRYSISPRRAYVSMLALKKDDTVVVRATDFCSSFKLNKAQKKDFSYAYRHLDYARFKKKRHKGKRPSQDDNMDVFLQVRRKDGSVWRWSNVKWQHPGPDLIFDTLEVWVYLARPEEQVNPDKAKQP